jgi:hypothetical protein
MIQKKTAECHGNLSAWLARIESYQSVEEIGSLFVIPIGNVSKHSTETATNGDYSVLNFDNLFADPQEAELSDDEKIIPKKTIEFRQHSGTIDFEVIAAQVELCATLVHYCTVASGQQIFKLYAHKMSTNGINLLELFTAIHMLEELFQYYRSRVHPTYVRQHNKNFLDLRNWVYSGDRTRLQALEGKVKLECMYRERQVLIGYEIEVKM